MGTGLEANLAERGPGTKGTSMVGARQSRREYHTCGRVVQGGGGFPEMARRKISFLQEQIKGVFITAVPITKLFA